jgi:capsule biosynthesis phosphatase
VRVCIDIDGVIGEIRDPGHTYAEVKVIPGAPEAIQKLRADGHYVILQTARHMQTCDSNEGLVLRRVGLVTLQWLEDHQIEYDEIYFGKPNADVYLDDRAVRFRGWDTIGDYLSAEA